MSIDQSTSEKTARITTYRRYQMVTMMAGTSMRTSDSQYRIRPLILLLSPLWVSSGLSAEGLSQSTFGGPASFQSPHDHQMTVKPSAARPFRERMGFTVQHDQVIVALVAGLLKPSRPSAIRRLIVPVVVDALDAVARTWARPHISQKRLERMSPTVTDANAAATVTSKASGFLVAASFDDSAPNLIFGSAA